MNRRVGGNPLTARPGRGGCDLECLTYDNYMGGVCVHVCARMCVCAYKVDAGMEWNSLGEALRKLSTVKPSGFKEALESHADPRECETGAVFSRNDVIVRNE